MLKNVIKEMNTLGINVVSRAKSNLSKNNSSGDLSNSLTYEIDQTDPDDVKLNFYGLDYANFVDQGVQGKDPQAMPQGSMSRYNKAPMSPYQFGTGSYSGSGSLRGSIDKWVVQKGIPNVRDAKGKFIKRKTMVYLISRSIWYTGIKPTYFFTNAQDEEAQGVQLKFATAYSRDLSEQLKNSTKKRRRK
jgi:hypothetical protein